MKKINLDNFRNYVEESYTYADVCRKLGWKPTGANYTYVKKYIKELELDTSHFTGQATNIGNKLMKSKEKKAKEYLTTNSYVSAKRLKWKLFSEGLKEYRCEKCGQNHWNGGQISLQLHHINGDNTDNRIENLQILCPNCHSQTDNFCGNNNHNKNINKIYTCRMCGKKIGKTISNMCDKCYEKLCNGIVDFGNVKQNGNIVNKKIKNLNENNYKRGVCERCGKETNRYDVKLCVKCARLQQRKVERPTKEELKKLIFEKPFTTIAKEYGISDNAVRKWCKGYGLPYRKKDLKKYF